MTQTTQPADRATRSTRSRPRTRLRRYHRRGDADASRTGHQGPPGPARHRPLQRDLGHDLDPPRGRRRHADHGPPRRPLRQAPDAAHQPRGHGRRLARRGLHQRSHRDDRGPRPPGLRHGRHPPRHRPDARRAAAREARVRDGPDELLHRRRRRTRAARWRPWSPSTPTGTPSSSARRASASSRSCSPSSSSRRARSRPRAASTSSARSACPPGSSSCCCRSPRAATGAGPTRRRSACSARPSSCSCCGA